MALMNKRMMNVLVINLLNESLEVVLEMNLLEIMFDSLLAIELELTSLLFDDVVEMLT